MAFSIDKQTIEELNLLGKFRTGSVYHLFNRVKTRGGEHLLEKMFQEPLTDAVSINRRADILKYFEKSGMTFPFDTQQLTLMRDYLDENAAGGGMMVLGRILLKKGLSLIARDDRYKKIVLGFQATIVTINRCFTFIQSFANSGPYSDRIHSVRRILSDRRLAGLRNLNIYKSVPIRVLAYYDHLLKGKLSNEMNELLTFIYEVDVFIAVSDTARAKGFRYADAVSPEINVFNALKLYHPCIDGAVGNTLMMDERSNVLFLTGANMAGKSTLMKAVGINFYLAHMGFPVAATSLQFSVREGMYSSINVADNMNLGYSHFYAEVVRVKKAAEEAASGKRLLLMFDELFKGTNVKDAYDGTLSVTDGFCDYVSCIFIISTHIIEVGEALKARQNIRFAYMPTLLQGSQPRYTYQLADGITQDRQGMMIIRNEGILELINAK